MMAEVPNFLPQKDVLACLALMAGSAVVCQSWKVDVLGDEVKGTAIRGFSPVKVACGS